MDNEKLIKYLKDRRLELGLSLRDVAQIVGVNASTVNRWESGEIDDMKRKRVFAYAKALQISPSIIMGWQDVPEGIVVELTKYEEQLLDKFRALDSEQQHVIETMINALYKEVRS